MWKQLFLLLVLLVFVDARRQCAHVIGQFRCAADPSKHDRLQVDMYDRDFGRSGILSKFNYDDRASFEYTDDEGHFEFAGCASDPDFFILRNDPDFYLLVRHECHGVWEEREFPITSFVPETFDFEVIHL